MKKISLYFARYWQVVCLAFGLIALAGVLYGYGTATFLPGISSAEQQVIAQTTSFTDILKNPLWLPYKLLLLLFQALGSEGAQLRIVSGICMSIAVFSFYAIAKRFYSPRVCVLTTILFAISAPSITLARVATPAVMLYSWIMFISLALWFRYSHKKRFAPFVFFVLATLLMYTPGTFWFVAILSILFWKDIPKLFKHLSRPFIIAGAVLGLVTAAPLFYSFVQDPNLIRSWLLLPTTFDSVSSLETLRTLPAAFFYTSSIDGRYNLGALPLLDAFSGTMLLLGLYAYRKKLKLQRTIIYITALMCSSALAVVNNSQLYLLLFLPIAYLIIAEGIGFLLGEWRSVFPKNPIARFVGTVVMSIAVIATSGYHLNRYFLAWVQAPETKAIYSEKTQ